MDSETSLLTEEALKELPAPGSLDYWRIQVDEWAKAHPNRRKAREVNEPETAAQVLRSLSSGESIYRAAKNAGMSKIEASRILFHHAEAMARCRAGNVGR